MIERFSWARIVAAGCRPGGIRATSRLLYAMVRGLHTYRWRQPQNKEIQFFFGKTKGYMFLEGNARGAPLAVWAAQSCAGCTYGVALLYCCPRMISLTIYNMEAQREGINTTILHHILQENKNSASCQNCIEVFAMCSWISI